MKCIFAFRMVRDGFSVSSKGMMGGCYDVYLAKVSEDVRQAIAREIIQYWQVA